MKSEKVLEILASLKLDEVPHAGVSLLAHLKDVHDLLVAWGESEAVALAGLCHSVCGTEFFRSQSITQVDTQVIMTLVGPEAERLIVLFSTCARDSFFDSTHEKSEYQLFSRKDGTYLNVTFEEYRALVAVSLANEIAMARVSKYRPNYALGLRKLEWLLSPGAKKDFQLAYGAEQNVAREVLFLTGGGTLENSLAHLLPVNGIDVTSISLNKETNGFEIADPYKAGRLLSTSEFTWDALILFESASCEQISKAIEFFGHRIGRVILESSWRVYESDGEFSEDDLILSDTEIAAASVFGQETNPIAHFREREAVAHAGSLKAKVPLAVVRAGEDLNPYVPSLAIKDRFKRYLAADVIEIRAGEVLPPLLTESELSGFFAYVLKKRLEGTFNLASRGQMDMKDFLSLLTSGFDLRPKFQVNQDVSTVDQTGPSCIGVRLNLSRMLATGFDVLDLNDWLRFAIEKIRASEAHGPRTIGFGL